MAEIEAGIKVDLTGNVTQASRRFQRSINGFADSGTRRLDRMKRSVTGLSNGINRAGNAAVLGGAAGFAVMTKVMLGTAAEFERFQLILEGLEGSSEKARKSMDWVSDFAAKTPFELQDVMAAFVKLKTFGLDPMRDGLLQTLGDTAASMGKPLEQAVEAIADAMTGENERLKEFGIKAKLEGNNVLFNYAVNGKEITKIANKNSREQIQSTLQAIWNDKYKGSMNRLSKSWEGMTSNLSDAWTRYQNTVMEQGAFDFMKDQIRDLLTEIERLDKAGQLDDSAKAISDKLVAGLKTAKEMGAGVWEVLKGIGAAAKQIAGLVGGYENLGKALAAIYVGNKVLRFGTPLFNAGAGAFGGIKSHKESGNPLLSAASGLKPIDVFVVNNIPGALGGKGKALLSKGKKLSNFGLLKNQTLKTTASMGGKALALSAGYVGAAGLGGYAIGALISKAIEGTDFQNSIGRGVAAVLAGFGNKNAQAALNSDAASTAYINKLEIELTGDGAKNATVKSIDAANLDLEVGGSMTAP